MLSRLAVFRKGKNRAMKRPRISEAIKRYMVVDLNSFHLESAFPREKNTFANPMFNFRELSRGMILHIYTYLHRIPVHIGCIYKYSKICKYTMRLFSCCRGSSSSWGSEEYSTTDLGTHEATSG